MSKRGRRGWFGDHRRHVLAGKGVSTVLPDGRRLDVSNFVAGGKMSVGERFNYDVEQIVNNFNPTMDEYGYKWKIDTIYGSLLITVHDPEPRQKIFNIFTRFENPKRAKEGGLDVNPYSGKWNFHYFDSEYALEVFNDNIKSIYAGDLDG